MRASRMTTLTSAVIGDFSDASPSAVTDGWQALHLNTRPRPKASGLTLTKLAFSNAHETEKKDPQPLALAT